MDVRNPDFYKTETLVDTNTNTNTNNPVMDDELEQVLHTSLVESWQNEKRRKDRWDSFQGLLETLKRIGHFDKTIQTVYHLLSDLLYRYAYEIEAYLSEDQETFILQNTKTVRIRTEDRERLSQTLTHLRFFQ